MANEDPEEQAAWLAAFRAAYGPGGNPAGRAALLARLLAGLTPAAQARLRTRWRAWAFDLPEAGQAVTPADAQHFEALLPALLAATLDPSGADYAWVQGYLERGDAVRAEVAELQQVLDEERVARQEAGADTLPRPFPVYDLSFLAETPPTEARETGWAAIRVALEQTVEAGQRGLRLIFLPRPTAAPGPQAGIAEAAVIYDPQADDSHLALAPGDTGAWTTLLAQTVDLGSAPGHPRHVTVTVQAQPATPGTCRLRIHLGGPGVAGHEAAIRLRVGTASPVMTGRAGEARLVVPLPPPHDLAITVLLPW